MNFKSIFSWQLILLIILNYYLKCSIKYFYLEILSYFYATVISLKDSRLVLV